MWNYIAKKSYSVVLLKKWHLKVSLDTITIFSINDIVSLCIASSVRVCQNPESITEMNKVFSCILWILVAQTSEHKSARRITNT